MNDQWQLKVEQTINFLAEQGAKTKRLDFLTLLVKFLSELFDADYVLVDHYDQKQPDRTSTISVYNRGRYLPNFSYLLVNTPCANVIGNDFCCYPEKVQEHFPDDSGLKKMRVNSYAAMPLWNSTGNPIGLIAILDSKNIENRKTYELVLKLASLKTADVLEKYFYENELEKQYQLFHSMFEISPDGVLITTADGKIQRSNKALKKLFDYAADELVNQHVKCLFSDPEIVQKGLNDLAAARDGSRSTACRGDCGRCARAGSRR